MKRSESKQVTTNRTKAIADAKAYPKLPRRLKKRHKKNLEASWQSAGGVFIYRWRMRYSPEHGWWFQKTLRTQYRKSKDPRLFFIYALHSMETLADLLHRNLASDATAGKRHRVLSTKP